MPEGAVAGQLSRADIELIVSGVLAIPVHTIHHDPQGPYVYRAEKDKDGHAIVKKVYIVQGQQYGSVAEVLSGLKQGDRIVNRGILGLRDGKKVEITASELDDPGIAITTEPGSIRTDGDKQTIEMKKRFRTGGLAAWSIHHPVGIIMLTLIS